MSSYRIITFFITAALFSGCATKQTIQSEIDPTQADSLISQDLVNVLSQVPTLQVGQVSLQVPKPDQFNGDFGNALVFTLQNAGYSLSQAGDKSQLLPVSYTINQAVGSADGALYTYTVNIGDVSVRRTYQPQSDGWVAPASDLQVRGAIASNLFIDNNLFQRARTPQEKTTPARNSVPRPQPLPEFAALDNPQTPTPVTSRDGSSAVALATTDYPPVRVTAHDVSAQKSSLGRQDSFHQPLFKNTSPTLAPSQKQNVRNLGESNYASILNSMSIVKEAVLIFDNDSTVLGSANKAQVGQFVKAFDRTKDVFSVIGCSHGPTALAGGQESLALGRAQRIKEELMFAGVPENSILDEGCWAHEQFDKRMPRRGVVLALKRQG